jgi:hypothetical protein
MEKTMTKSATAVAEARQVDHGSVPESAELRRLVTENLLQNARESDEDLPLLEALILAKHLRAGGFEEAMQAHVTLVGDVRDTLQELGVADEPHLKILNLLVSFLSGAGYKWDGKRGWIVDPMVIALDVRRAALEEA